MLRSRFLRDGAALASGSIVTQFLAIGTAPLMARLYEPSAYGLLGAYTAFFGIITVSASLQYEQAVVLPRDDEDALAIVKGGMLLGLCTLGVLLLAYLGPLSWLAKGTAFEAVSAWVPLMILCHLPASFSIWAGNWLARKQMFRFLSISRMCGSLATTATGLAIGFWLRPTWGLVLASAIGVGVTAFMLAYGMYLSGGWRFRRSSILDVKTQLKTHYRFPLFGLPSAFLTTFRQQSPVLLLMGLAGPTAVGYFNMSNRLLGLPNTLFAASMTEVFRQRAAKQYAETGQCHDLYKRMLIGLVATTFPCVALLAMIAPDLFAILLGEPWRAAGEYSRLLCWVFALQLVCSPLSAVMVIANRQAENLIAQTGSLVMILAIIWSAHQIWGTVESMLVAFTIGSCMMYVYYGARGYWISQRSA